MKNNEIKWAIGIGIVMITICIIAIMIAKGSSKEINLKVYKLNMIGESYKDYTKEPCKMSTDNLVTINKEFNHLFDEQGVQSFGAQRIDGNLCLRIRSEKQG